MKRLVIVSVFLLAMSCLSGCACLLNKPQVCEPTFAPQQVMQSGDYSGFLAENEKLLSTCKESNSCDAALFNLGFLYAYSKSPYFDRTEGLKYLGQLVKEYPQSPLAYEAMVWMDFIVENVTLDKKQRNLQGQVKSKDAARKRLQREVKSKDETINELRDQIKRSRDIDVEMGRKEREVLY